MIAHRQLVELGLTPSAIKHRIATSRLHVLWRGVYAVGRRDLTPRGWWMAAVLACGPDAVLSHQSAGELWGILARSGGPLHVSVIAAFQRRRRGIVVHRRVALARADVTAREEIPVTTPACTLIDLAPMLERERVEAAVNAADKLDLIDPEELRAELDVARGRPGAALLRDLLDSRTFVLTDSELERRFVPIALKSGLPPPETQRWIAGFRVDFYWPALGLVAETDGLRYHRTAAQQSKDRERDQALAAEGLTVLRFTHAQVRYEAARVESVLAAVARRQRRLLN